MSTCLLSRNIPVSTTIHGLRPSLSQIKKTFILAVFIKLRVRVIDDYNTEPPEVCLTYRLSTTEANNDIIMSKTSLLITLLKLANDSLAAKLKFCRAFKALKRTLYDLIHIYTFNIVINCVVAGHERLYRVAKYCR